MSITIGAEKIRAIRIMGGSKGKNEEKVSPRYVTNVQWKKNPRMRASQAKMYSNAREVGIEGIGEKGYLSGIKKRRRRFTENRSYAD